MRLTAPAPPATLAAGVQQGHSPPVSAPAAERLMNHRIYDWLRRSLLRGRCGGQAPSNTKQAELMGILWRKRGKDGESCVYIGE